MENSTRNTFIDTFALSAFISLLNFNVQERTPMKTMKIVVVMLCGLMKDNSLKSRYIVHQHKILNRLKHVSLSVCMITAVDILPQIVIKNGPNWSTAVDYWYVGFCHYS